MRGDLHVCHFYDTVEIFFQTFLIKPLLFCQISIIFIAAAFFALNI